MMQRKLEGEAGGSRLGQDHLTFRSTSYASFDHQHSPSGFRDLKRLMLSISNSQLVPLVVRFLLDIFVRCTLTFQSGQG
jgi:hypothetical protein